MDQSCRYERGSREKSLGLGLRHGVHFLLEEDRRLCGRAERMRCLNSCFCIKLKGQTLLEESKWNGRLGTTVLKNEKGSYLGMRKKKEVWCYKLKSYPAEGKWTMVNTDYLHDKK